MLEAVTKFLPMSPDSWLLAQQSDPGWLNVLLTSRHFSMLVVFGFLSLVVLVPSLAGYWYKARVKEWETSLKHAMLERGMSSAEICSVLEAGSRACSSADRNPVDQNPRADS